MSGPPPSSLFCMLLEAPPPHTQAKLFLQGPSFCARCFCSSYRLVAAMVGYHTYHKELVLALVFDHVLWVRTVWPVRNVERIVLGPSVRAEGYEIKKKRKTKQNQNFFNKSWVSETRDADYPDFQRLLLSSRMWLWPWWLSHCDRHNPMGEGSFWLVVSEITQSIMSEGCGSGRGNCVCLSYHGLLRNKEFSDSYLPTRPQLLRPPKPFKHSTRKGLQRQY